jgi:transposase
MSCKKIATIFQISTRTLYNWTKRRLDTGDSHCKTLPLVRSTRKLTPEKLLAYVSQHPDHYLKEIAEAFGVKPQSVASALMKFGISRKKNNPLLRARRQEEARLQCRNRDN